MEKNEKDKKLKNLKDQASALKILALKAKAERDKANIGYLALT